MDKTSQGTEEEEEEISQCSEMRYSQNDTKLNELSQMMCELKEEIYRMQVKNTNKMNKVQDMVTCLYDSAKTKEETKEEPKVETKTTPTPNYSRDNHPLAFPKPDSSNTQQKKDPWAPVQKTGMSLAPKSPPPMSQPPCQSMPPMSPPPCQSMPPMPQPPFQSMPPMSPPPGSSMPPMSSPPPPPHSMPYSSQLPISWSNPQNYHQRSQSNPAQRPLRRQRRPDPEKLNILKATLRVVAELNIDELKRLEWHLHDKLT
ncbi:peptidyl serine alpha-galactosyltransferase-like [Drosophila serrata]|uniref:peptidyl serine alpha-galactosyltransferase-like n=1 Tax=Drosophila serrata TaxID=7274 RepID=UPI000A1D0F11|nr:peptidyl serine alpha-galactosyltransferase-like [Drosophila serrata]